MRRNWWRLAPVLVVVWATLAIGVHYVRPAEPMTDSAGVAVVADRISASDGGARLSVLLRVDGGAENIGPVSVFWMIGVPGAPRPWDAPRYVAPERRLNALPAHASIALDWSNVPVDLPPAQYEVTAWVHAIQPDQTTQHLAGGPVGTFVVARPVPTSMQFGPDFFEHALGPLVLDSLTIDQQPSGEQLLSVRARVRNSGSAVMDGRTQLVIGRFDDPQPFRSAFWQTSWATIPTLQAGAAYELSWQTPVGLPAGLYGLTMFVHARINGTFEHSQATFSIPLQFEANALHVQRSGPAPAGLHIASAALDTEGAHVSIANPGREQHVLMASEMLPERRRFDWYLTPIEPSGDTLTFDSSATRTVTLPGGMDCTAETRLRHLTLYDAQARAMVDDVLLDVCPA